mgnify:CR=1 FL=1
MSRRGVGGRGRLADEQPGRPRGAAISRVWRSAQIARRPLPPLAADCFARATSRGRTSWAAPRNRGTKTERIQLWAVTKPNMTSSRPNDAVLKAKAAQHSKAEGDLTTTNADEVGAGAVLAVLQAQFELNSTDLTWKLPLCPKSKLGWYGLSKPGLCDVKCQPRPCCICM